jgi:hypothetical protein
VTGAGGQRANVKFEIHNGPPPPGQPSPPV